MSESIHRISWVAFLCAVACVTEASDGVVTSPMPDSSQVQVSLQSLRTFGATPSLALRNLFFLPTDASERADAVDTAIRPGRATIVPDDAATHVDEPPQLIGIAIRGSTREAFFVNGEKSYVVREGRALTERYQIERIEARRVRLRDRATGLVRTIDWAEEHR